MRSVKTSSVAWVLAIAIAAAAAIRAVDLTWRRMESSPAGRAKWIWLTDDVKAPHPVRFSVSRAFILDRPIESARARIFVDRSYRFSLDGTLLGSGTKKPGDGMDEYDLSGRFPEGRHDLVIEAESPTGIGGILFGLDLAGLGRNFIVSDEKWSAGGHPPFCWGMPPIYPWEFPEPTREDSAARAAAQ